MSATKRLVLAAMCFLLTALFIPYDRVLVIRNRKNSIEKVYSKKALQGFIISYTHSVNKGRVKDYYKIQGRKLIVHKTEFVSYGAGMPEIQDTAKSTFRVSDKNYELCMTRSVKKLFMAIGLIAEHSIAFTGNMENEFFLKDFFKPQTAIILEVKNISIIQKILYRKIEK